MTADTIHSPGPYARVGKRCLDLVLASVALITLSPLFVIIAGASYLFEQGPALFVQERIGKDGNPFRFFKFRSMPVGTRNVASDQLGQVPITAFGRLLRRTNLDELPQLFNILRGDMSIVGPRPPLPSQTELIALRATNGALSCRPGLTGLAQVSSYDGMPVNEKARLDGDYAADVTLTGDLAIIGRTFAYLIKPPPVY